MSLFGELNRRNVFRVLAAYLVFGWLVLQIADVVFPALHLPEWSVTLVTVLLAIGLVPVLVFSWIYELTPEGVKKESEIDRTQSITPQTGRKLDQFTLVALVAVVAFVFVERSMRTPESPAPVAPPVSTGAVAETVETPASPVTRSPASEPSDSRPSVAVLPFTTRSTDPEDAFFTDGIHDDLLTQLAKIAALKVISRTSVMEYRDTTKKIPEIADELGVSTVMEGAVQRAGQRVRINAQLIDADTDEHLWAETFDRELTLDNLFEIQSEIATAIASALKTTLSADEQQSIARKPTDNLEAWQAYRRALYNLDNIGPEYVDRAELEARRALELDPNFAAAYAILARVHLFRYWFFGIDPDLLTQARQALDAGRAIDPDAPELDVAEGYYHYWGHLDYDAALAVLDRAIAVAPNDVELLKVKGYALRRDGRYAESNQTLIEAYQLDPREALIPTTLAETYAQLGRYDEARRWVDRARSVRPTDRQVASQQAYIDQLTGNLEAAARGYEITGNMDSTSRADRWYNQLALGRFEKAVELSDFGAWADSQWAVRLPDALAGIARRVQGRDDLAAPLLASAREELERRLASDPDDARILRALCWVSGAQRDREAAGRFCARALENPRPDAFEINNIRLEIARGLALAGDHDQALAVLESMLEDPTRVRAPYLRQDPFLVPLRTDPRWEPLLARIDQR